MCKKKKQGWYKFILFLKKEHKATKNYISILPNFMLFIFVLFIFFSFFVLYIY